MFLADDTLRDSVQEKVGDVVRERAAYQELHRQVVHHLGVLARVRRRGEGPTLGQQIPHRSRKGLELVAGGGSARISCLIEEKMAVVQRVFAADEVHRAISIPGKDTRKAVRLRVLRKGDACRGAHCDCPSSDQDGLERTQGVRRDCTMVSIELLLAAVCTYRLSPR